MFLGLLLLFFLIKGLKLLYKVGNTSILTEAKQLK